MGIKGWGFVLLATSLMGVTAKADWWPKDEDYKVVNKVINIVGHSCVREKQARTPKVYMAYLRGSPIDALNAPEAGERWKWMMTKIAEERHYNLQIETAHHTWWRSICREIKNQKPDTTVLVGHSYGTSGISKVAGCLQEANMKVDSLLTISSYDMLAGVDVTNVPINVAENLNFWTNSSTPGYDNHVAINPAVTFVRNIFSRSKRRKLGAS